MHMTSTPHRLLLTNKVVMLGISVVPTSACCITVRSELYRLEDDRVRGRERTGATRPL